MIVWFFIFVFSFLTTYYAFLPFYEWLFSFFIDKKTEKKETLLLSAPEPNRKPKVYYYTSAIKGYKKHEKRALKTISV